MFLTRLSSFICHQTNHTSKFMKGFSRVLETDFTKLNQFRSYGRPRVAWKKKEKRKEKNEDDIETVGNLSYKILQPNSSNLTQLLVAAKSRKYRYEKHVILVEGKRLIAEALKANIKPVMIIFNRRHLIADLPLDPNYVAPDTTVLHKLLYNHIKLWSDLTTSPGIFGIFQMPNLEKNQRVFDPLPVTIVCDNIREPGNLGSILRVAAAIPVKKVILLTGCTDLWDSKVIRGSSGAMFYLTVQNNASWEDVKNSCKGNVIIADHIVHVPSVAGITRAEVINEEVDDELCKNNDDNDDIEAEKDLREIYKLPLMSYFDVNYEPDQSYTFIIGGETHGLSEECFEFAASNNGCRVNIPLSECANSLNSATALGIITFEMKKQYNSKFQDTDGKVKSGIIS